ncbi:3-oxoacyl-ACP synthase [Caldimicrobium thiodismutans]|jgi:3-oxoacyl-[acyl-carrier protein] reductase|uniref:3-oxoacyl-[acyl-carrier-protein] reductase n=1 Tax=Caldimicrobium thiodismutans TaxID=1653476 RepID=A0A0U5AWE7_9BACT|nr:3-oxoacyl-[acyl-carrier-protein] reductase [Caldimicrobium thiodismutans]BAU22894.1 3-oxoacyl-ACP synthase [Caldimicrobium thiodismutans]
MLQGKIALVTGASRGIGRAIAKELARAGAEVVINYLGSEDKAKEVKDSIEAIGGKAHLSRFDVSKPEEVKKALKEIEETLGNIHILVNNAGITRDTLFIRMKEEDWDAVLKTNLFSAFYVTQAVLPMMLKTRWGRIINISSVVAFTGNPGQVNYATAKAGLIGFTKALSLEVAGRNITVNAIAPGYIETDMTEKLPEKVKEAFLQEIPLKRAGLPEEVAYLTVFLASDQASYITGTVFHINGGLFRG